MCVITNKNNIWRGRSGNNLLSMAFSVFNYPNANNKLLPHKLFKLNLPHKNNVCICNKQIIIEYWDFQNLIELQDIKRTAKNQITLNINSKSNKIYDIGIHIRSGDIFTGQSVNHKYIQPPLIAYTKLIDEYIQNSNIIIVFENDMNPIVNLLKQSYKNNSNLVFQSSTIENDILTLMNCKTLVFSQGSFCLIPYCFSETINKVILFDYFIETGEWFKINETNSLYEIIKLPNYYKNNWKNIEELKKYMIEYK